MWPTNYKASLRDIVWSSLVAVPWCQQFLMNERLAEVECPFFWCIHIIPRNKFIFSLLGIPCKSFYCSSPIWTHKACQSENKITDLTMIDYELEVVQVKCIIAMQVQEIDNSPTVPLTYMLTAPMNFICSNHHQHTSMILLINQKLGRIYFNPCLTLLLIHCGH